MFDSCPNRFHFCLLASSHPGNPALPPAFAHLGNISTSFTWFFKREAWEPSSIFPLAPPVTYQQVLSFLPSCISKVHQFFCKSSATPLAQAPLPGLQWPPAGLPASCQPFQVVLRKCSAATAILQNCKLKGVTSLAEPIGPSHDSVIHSAMCSHFTLSQPSHTASHIHCQAQGHTASHTGFTHL